MSNNPHPKGDDAKTDPLNSLTDSQKMLLLQAIHMVKQQVFDDVTKRIRRYLLVAASLVTLFGAVSFVGLKTAIKDATVGAFREDSRLRQSIKDDVATKLTEAEKLLEDIRSVLERAKGEKLAVAHSTTDKLKELLADAEQERREENLLFERSAEELKALINELSQLKRERQP